MRTHFRDQVYDRPQHVDKNAQGPGIYLTTNKEEAQGYAGAAGKVHTITLKPGARVMDYKRAASRKYLEALIKLAPKTRRDIGLSNWDENPKVAMKRALDTYQSEDEWLQGTLGIYHDFYGDTHPNDFAKANVKAGVDAVRVGQHLVVYNPEILVIQKHEEHDYDPLDQFEALTVERHEDGLFTINAIPDFTPFPDWIANEPLESIIGSRIHVFGEPLDLPDVPLGMMTESQADSIRNLVFKEIQYVHESQMVKHYFDFSKMKGGIAKKTGEHTDDARKVSNHPTIIAISQKLRTIWGKLERESSRKERFKMVRAVVGPKLARYMKSIPETDEGAFGKRDSGSTTDQEKFDDEEPRQRKDKQRKTLKRSARRSLDTTNVFPASGGPLDLAYEAETDATDEADLKKLAGMMAQRGMKPTSRKKGKSVLTGDYV